MEQKRAIIIGAGPAGLTAAWELLTRTGIQPIVLEKSEYMGGISRTVNYKGNRIDIGGHRFFSKSDRVMQWWMNILPLQGPGNGGPPTIAYHGMKREVAASSGAPDPETIDKVMLVRPRKSRIYYLRKFFEYPITLSKATLLNLGLVRTARIGLSYLRSEMFPIRDERTLEHFIVNRFGRELYRAFFESYTEKVWGVPCSQISAEWGAQRIKGLSIWKTLQHALRMVFGGSAKTDLSQKEVQTSLIDQFLYPKFGPGQMWEEVACQVRKLGGEIHTGYRVDRIFTEGKLVRAIQATHVGTGSTELFEGDYFFSTAPIKELLRSFDPAPPANVLEVSDGLVYRDFITVGLLVNGLKINESASQGKKLISDNWIYIQEPDVLIGRLQVFNNWSPWMVNDPAKVWLGLEYFCNEGDELWKRSDDEMIRLGQEELAKIGIIDEAAVEDGTVLRMEKTYPAYFGSYGRFSEVREFVDGIANLFLVGRNGMHKYNNQDHSMLTAMIAVDNIAAGITDKSNLWEVNTEMEYHEGKEKR
jgi:protoporphyrinogen oxidase